MPVLIALFNHKGGVSKTTTAFNLGWAMAERGKRVRIVDGDPQCNLTGTVLGFDGVGDFTAFYAENPDANISDCLEILYLKVAASDSLQPRLLPHRWKICFCSPATSRKPKMKPRYLWRFPLVRLFLHYKISRRGRRSSSLNSRSERRRCRHYRHEP